MFYCCFFHLGPGSLIIECFNRANYFNHHTYRPEVVVTTVYYWSWTIQLLT